LRRGREEKGKTTGKLAGGATESEGERKGGESRRVLGLGEKKGDGPAWPTREEEKEERGGKRWAGRRAGPRAFVAFLLFPFLFYTETFKQLFEFKCKLNSNL
jgi:hypothetical protein